MPPTGGGLGGSHSAAVAEAIATAAGSWELTFVT